MKLLAKSGILIIQDLIGLDKADIKRIAKRTTGLSADGLTGIRDAISYTVIAEDALEGVYWLDEANPHAARYGIEKDEWGVEA